MSTLPEYSKLASGGFGRNTPSATLASFTKAAPTTAGPALSGRRTSSSASPLRMNSCTCAGAEPAGAPQAAARLFVVEQNGILYTLDKKSRAFTPYIDFGKIYARFNTDPNLGMGLVSMAFDPDYAKNGKFYTVHTENPRRTQDAQAPSNVAMPSLDLSQHKVTPQFTVPAGVTLYESIVTEWRDTNIGNASFNSAWLLLRQKRQRTRNYRKKKYCFF